MPICPNCGKEINHLINICETIERYIIQVVDENIIYERDDAWPGDFSEYYCPICETLLFNNEEDAKKFLITK